MPRAGAFTLVELILVMGLLCIILGLAAPSLSRSFHQRNLMMEATRLLGLTEYARDEAVSKGVPTVVWTDAETGEFGAKAKSGFEDSGVPGKEFKLSDGTHFEDLKNLKNTKSEAGVETDAIEFAPDGTLDPASQTSLRLVDRSNSAVTVSQTTDTWGYQIVKETQ